MHAATKEVATVAVLCCIALLAGAATGQESAPDAARREPPSTVDDEVVVRGRSRAELRLQMQLAEEAVYARFNEINSSDEFDIHCLREPVTGSRILRRVCQPEFWRNAQARAAEETVRAMQGSPSTPVAAVLGEAMYKGELLEDEMRRLAREDDQLLKALLRLANLKIALDGGRVPRVTAARVSTAGDHTLPYGASLMAEVRIEREPWTHELTERTFTIARVYGTIREIAVHCDGHEEQLQWEVGAEWTIPEDWGSCTLEVDAERGTTFALYEFE
ncbi:MAG TPA: hypothetical protein VF329_05210 [Gammaproteobacteria bacterium]